MTDKVQKIRNEVERLQRELIEEKEKGFGSDADDACIMELQNVLTYIDSLQEQPVSNDLVKELDRYLQSNFTIDTEQLDRFGIEEKDYMYSMDKSDMQALVEHFINWYKTKEEPISEKKCIFTKDSYIDEERKVLCEDCKEKCEYSKKEEPVCEDLEEAMQHNAPNNIGIDDLLYWRNGFITGSKWQKQEDDRETKMVRELLADFDKHCDEYHEAGFKHGQEALIKEAVNAKVHNNGIVVDSCDIAGFLDKCNDGEEIKIIPIKED